MESEVVTCKKDLIDLCDRSRAAGVLALDTEFIGEQCYRPKICLLQVAAPDLLALIDPLAIEDLEPFWGLMTDPAVTIITHAGRNDFAACYRWTARSPKNIFDTQIAAGLVGVGYPLSYAALVLSVLSVRLRKLETLTDWSRRPLHAKQIEYALEDVRHLLPLYEELSARLTKLGRQAWAEQEFAPLQTDAVYEIKPEELYQRIKGAGSLRPRQMGVLQVLTAWRERQAQDRDRPARSILPDHLLIELSRRQPRTEGDLGAIRGLSARVARQVRSQIPALIVQALELPDEQLPPPTDRGGRDADCKAAVDLAAAVVSHLAHRQQVAPDLLATRRELERYFLWRLGASEKPPESLTVGWRAELLSDPLDALFAGRTRLSLQRAGKNLRLRVQPDDVAKMDCS